MPGPVPEPVAEPRSRVTYNNHLEEVFKSLQERLGKRYRPPGQDGGPGRIYWRFNWVRLRAEVVSDLHEARARLALAASLELSDSRHTLAMQRAFDSVSVAFETLQILAVKYAGLADIRDLGALSTAWPAIRLDYHDAASLFLHIETMILLQSGDVNAEQRSDLAWHLTEAARTCLKQACTGMGTFSNAGSIAPVPRPEHLASSTMVYLDALCEAAR